MATGSKKFNHDGNHPVTPTIDVCSCCGGELPAEERRDSHLRTDGTCPGHLTTDRTGRVLGCGAWTVSAYR